MLIRCFGTQIPRAVREQLWLNTYGEKFKGKCQVEWCNNTINVFDFTAGHNIPKSKGGSNNISNFIFFFNNDQLYLVVGFSPHKSN